MPGYYDIDDILMEEEPISVVFQVTANGVGLLDPGAETNCVSVLRLTRKEIQADAACVDLRVRCPYFYELGCKIVPLVTDKSIGPFLRYSFTSRYKEILSKSHSSSLMTVPKFVRRLTREETRGKPETSPVVLVHMHLPTALLEIQYYLH
ncbi:hypothetical protein PR202_ga27814 [Eleusine coracana subsp. coracana]|uniref:GINS subunit domain-containing protein n=1 Tax=Eleusine coracana subsp. coracana TaxID=191504 RepID=A0AAV5DFG1_ELECO|nr:hypothetical protein PR202_ga27814 [Eleusine coracana subsp. coracana]